LVPIVAKRVLDGSAPARFIRNSTSTWSALPRPEMPTVRPSSALASVIWEAVRGAVASAKSGSRPV